MIFQHSELPMKSNQIENWWRKKVEIKYCRKKLTTFFSSNFSIKSAWCIIKQLYLLVCCNRFAHLNIINVSFSSFDFEFLFCSALFLPMQTNACIFFSFIISVAAEKKNRIRKTHLAYALRRHSLLLLYIFAWRSVPMCVYVCALPCYRFRCRTPKRHTAK